MFSYSRDQLVIFDFVEIYDDINYKYHIFIKRIIGNVDEMALFKKFRPKNNLTVSSID